MTIKVEIEGIYVQAREVQGLTIPTRGQAEARKVLLESHRERGPADDLIWGV